MDSESEGADGSVGAEKKSKAASSADTSKWPIPVGHSKVSGCCLCSARSTGPNPLVEEVDDAAAMEAHRPWAKYRKVDKHFVRVPEGKRCLPCLNVSRLLGKHSKYGTYQAYYKHISQKANQAAQNEHKDFLASLKQWLKQQRENSEKFKLKDKDDLMKTQRQLVISKKQGGKLTGPKNSLSWALTGTRSVMGSGTSQRGWALGWWCVEKGCVAQHWPWRGLWLRGLWGLVCRRTFPG